MPLGWSGLGVFESWGYVDSGFRRNDVRGESCNSAGVAGLFLGVGVAWFPAFAGMTGGVGVAVRLEWAWCPWELGVRGFRLSPERR